MLFKRLILQPRYKLTDEALEFQILDRYLFSRFLGLHAGKGPVPRNTRKENQEIKKGNIPEKWFAKNHNKVIRRLAEESINDYFHKNGKNCHLLWCHSASTLDVDENVAIITETG
ncbi:transposase [Desulforhopalus vacuolatus]|uniref:transposase n=1 Tax=Desulforhopalus vacuolatus TaxID=40414 RepID=UPI00196564C2|nr:transposase [Desulforhopalus vacuolatus]MBM9518945.1 transposase [Desulforhopalus vacuolatus]